MSTAPPDNHRRSLRNMNTILSMSTHCLLTSGSGGVTICPDSWDWAGRSAAPGRLPRLLTKVSERASDRANAGSEMRHELETLAVRTVMEWIAEKVLFQMIH